MRLKNILFTIAATTWLFSSCSEETLVDGPVISGGEEATISATLSINSVETKAAANYEFPQDDAEKKMFLEDLGLKESGLEKLVKASESGWFKLW